MNSHPKAALPLVLLVTGMSGAGKTCALKSLEDLGFEAVDNAPLSLLGSLAMPSKRGLERPIAIGVDIRTRDFGVEAFMAGLDVLTAEGRAEVKVLFMDCDDDELKRRYGETRHRHPLAIDRPLSDGIASERRLISRLRQRADLILDTTGLAPRKLKNILQGHFGAGSGDAGNDRGLSVFIMSFSYRDGLPREADLVFDVRFLANPHYDASLRDLTGKDERVAEFISNDKCFAPFFEALTGLLSLLLPRYAAEGKNCLTIAIGCTGGRHRSVFVADRLAAWVEKAKWPLQLNHKILD